MLNYFYFSKILMLIITSMRLNREIMIVIIHNKAKKPMKSHISNMFA